MSGRKIVVLATGGTIAGRAGSAHDNIGYTAAALGIEEVLAGVPALAGVPVQAHQVAQIDSKDMTLQVWRRLALQCAAHLADDEVEGVVITHGTDTLEETAFFLHEVLDASAKPVVLTGAMRPASSADADGPRNIADAVAVVRTHGAHGVLVAFAGAVHGAVDVAKQHSYRLDAFSSGDAGAFGYVEEGRLWRLREWPTGGQAQHSLARLAAGANWPRVEIVLNYAGASGAVVDALVRDGVDGLVAAGTGNGRLHEDLEAALVRAQESGVRVLRTSRCAQGRVLGEAGAVPHADGLSAVKARIVLLLELLR